MTVNPPMSLVREELASGYSVAYFVATDDDQEDTENSRITYSISDISATSASGASIDPVRKSSLITDIIMFIYLG